MHDGELWQEYNQAGEPLENGGRPAFLDNPKEGENSVVGIVIVIVIRKNKSGELELLWQQRGPKASHSGEWDLSAGGHVNYGETLPIAAKREAREEIGLKIDSNRFYYAYSIAQSKNRFCWAYVYDHTDLSDDFAVDKEEVSAVKWVPYKDTDNFLQNYVKKHVREDKLFFKALKGWLKFRGYN